MLQGSKREWHVSTQLSVSQGDRGDVTIVT